MTPEQPTVSVIVRAKDEEPSIARTLDLLARQKLGQHRLEVIVVDSGSSDGTARIAREHGARVIGIPAPMFTFGRALNVGCSAARGVLMVALSAHAFPAHDSWLERLLEPFADERVACASGDDFGPDRRPLERRVVQDLALAESNPFWGYSNAAGAFRAALWREHAFRADMPGTEDKEWAWHWLREGRVAVIDPELTVMHDHSKDPLPDIYRRARREWEGFAMYLPLPRPTLRGLVTVWWTDAETYRSPTRARLSHRRAARLLGKYAGRCAARSARPPAPTPFPGPPPGAPMRLAVFADRFPELSETFVAGEVDALRRAGHAVRVEANYRGAAAGDGPGTREVRYLAEETRGKRLKDMVWLLRHHPRRVLEDLMSRRRWRAEEPVPPLRALAPRIRRVAASGVTHLHAHFAAGAALDALRTGRLLGVPYSVTAHAYDIFLSPRGLPEKVERAAFSTSGCDYTVDYLRRLVAPEAAARIHRVVMGVDCRVWSRTSSPPGARHLVAVGRLVEKKGFVHAIAAMALLVREDPRYRLTIVGDGPLRASLEQSARELGVADAVALVGPRPPAGVRALLEEADLLVMPSIIAADGDRDSMPVVVKEALAMEVPVVASDEVGLPEVVRPGWGRLVPPGDAESLAGAISSVLSLDSEELAEMGRAGRTWVLEHANADREAERLVALALGRVPDQSGSAQSAGRPGG